MYKLVKKSAWVLATAISVVYAMAAPGIDFSAVEDFRVTQVDSSITLFAGKRLLAILSSKEDVDLRLVKIELVDGELKLDTRAYYEQYPKANIIMRLYCVPQEAIQTGKNAVLSVEMRSVKAGVEGNFSLTGAFSLEAAVTSRSYWAQPAPVLLLDHYQTFTYQRFIPTGINALSALFYLNKSGVFYLRSASVSYPAEKRSAAIDPDRNLMINGGAERGFYMAVPTDKDAIAPKGYNGVHFSKFGEWHNGSEYTIDSEEVHSGNYSFKIRSYESSYFDRLTLAPVPTITGKPLAFSAWMKADRPVDVLLWFVNSSGNRYATTVTVSETWQKYTLQVKRFGEQQDGTSGTPGNTAGYNLVFPAILVWGEGTVYVDDLRCQYNLVTADVGETAPVRIMGDLDRDTTYYFADEPIGATMHIEADQPTEAMLGWKLYDFFGDVIAQAAPEKVTLPLDRKITATVPADKRGAMRLVVTVTPKGAEAIDHGFYCGVIDRATTLDKRFGQNMNSYLKPEPLIRIMQDFGIGAIRLWRDASFALPKADCAATFHDAGFFVFYSFSRANYPHQFFLPKDPTNYLSQMENWINTVTRGKVDAYDLLNEPNAWGGANPDPATLLSPTIENVVELEAQMAAVIHRSDPGVPIAAPSVCHTRLDYMNRFLELGGDKFTDILTEHPYRAQAELPDYYADIQSIKAFSAKFSKDFRMLSTERGIRRPLFTRDGEITDQEQTIGQLRLLLTALAGGMEQFYTFNSYGVNPGLDFTDTMISATSHCNTVLPSTTTYAMRAAMVALQDAAPCLQVPFSFELRCHIFKRSDGTSAAMIWKWHGDQAKIRFAEMMNGYDMMGSRISGQEFMLTPAPLYFVSQESPEAFAETFRMAELAVTGDVASAKLIGSGKQSFLVRVSNLGAKSLSGSVEITRGGVPGENSKRFSELAPLHDTALNFQAAQPLSLAKQIIAGKIIPDQGKPVVFSLELSGLVCPKTPQAITIDGDLADWPAAAATFELDSANAASKRGTWVMTPAEKSIRAEGRITWDADHLYMAVTVLNKDFQTSATITAVNDIWQNDSVQVAFDPLANAVRSGVGYDNDDFEYSFSMFRGTPVVWREYASDAIYDSLMKRLGLIDEVPFAMKCEQGRTTYEMAFPTFTVSPFTLQAGSTMRFNVLINVSDGKARRGFLELAPGIGGAKSPFEFISIALTENHAHSQRP